MTSSSHGHHVVPVSEVGAGTVGVDDWVGVAEVVVGVVLGWALGDAEVPVGLREAPCVVVAVAVAVRVTVAVAVAAVVVVMAGVLEAAADTDGAVAVRVLDVAADADDSSDASSDGGDVAVLGVSDRVGARVGVGVSDSDGGRAVGSSTLGVIVTLGLIDRVGVGNPPPSPPEPHPARAAASAMSAAAITATRMVRPPLEGRASPPAVVSLSPMVAWLFERRLSGAPIVHRRAIVPCLRARTAVRL